MKTPLVSIALCSYNGEKYVAEQLESIITQTYENLEIIVLDDCSTDSTPEIVRAYQARDPRVSLYRNEHNLGFNKNFERAVSLATGRFIAISDQDDVWEPNKIQVLIDNIKDAWLIFSNSQYMEADGTRTERKLLKDFSLTGRNFKMLLLNNFVTGHTSMFTRELLDHALPFPDAGFYDWWMGFVALYHNRLAYVDRVLTRYRAHDGAVTSKSRLSPGEKHSYYFEMMCSQLSTFVAYPELQVKDRSYVERLNRALTLKRIRFSLPLFRMMLKDYDDLFSLIKRRKGLSRFNFARRFARAETKYA
ncbi:glycosyltransferase family 2 protein [Mucilaginibacter sp. FT3.2]|uniref:glycosyltransferase family 2 protein n=1 Tax=Mucilaginibacter sp. FT3.2 TaxID=2723090 RepID=UPI00161EF54F|nr:glycosyltransferase family 2 protein [Mucilaginibacter sp. FT3.2]MBB6230681.1 glycosyltransferase involved in cell wall biosynthesis [Mucilaginibacter sp. FT3.2]